MSAFHSSRVRALCAVLALPVLSGCKNLHTVEEGRFYRCAQPTQGDLTHWIWRYDIETVLRLRGGDPSRPSYRESFEPTVAAGIDFYQIPLSALRFPEKDALIRLCDVLENGRYPMIIHCKAGADRTGLVSAMYVLIRTGDLQRAREQLVLLPYGHLGWFGLDKPDLVLDMYEPWHGTLSFPEWARTVYQKPANDELPGDYIEQQRERVAAVRSQR